MLDNPQNPGNKLMFGISLNTGVFVHILNLLILLDIVFSAVVSCYICCVALYCIKT